MTPAELKSARQTLGLSARGLAQALGMSPSSGRTVRRWERGDFPVPGPIAVALTGLLAKRA